MDSQNLYQVVVAWMIATKMHVVFDRDLASISVRPARRPFVRVMSTTVLDNDKNRLIDEYLFDLLRFNSRDDQACEVIWALTSRDQLVIETWISLHNARTEVRRRVHARALVEALKQAQINDLQWRRIITSVEKNAA